MAASSSHSTSISSPLSIPDFTIHEKKLYLLGREGEDSSAYAISMKKTSIFSNSVSIQGTFEHKPVKFYVNASRVAKKLGLERSEVKEIAKKENGIFLLRRAAAIHQFMKNSNIEEKYREKLNTKYKKSEIQTFKIGKCKKDCRYFIDSKNFDLYTSERIGKGSLGKIFKISSMIDPETPPLALKKARRKTENAIADLQKEAEVLKLINPSGVITGIQLSPSLAAKYAYITHRYDSDLFAISSTEKFHHMTPEDKLKLMGQLLVGLAYFHELGYFHGDIKPENCLVKEDATPERKIVQFVLCDFGGVSEVSTWVPGTSKFTCTQEYVASEIDLSKPNSASALQSNDVFALAKTIIEVLINESVSESESTTIEQEEKLKTIIPESLAYVFLEGMHFPIARKLTAAQFLNDFHVAFMKEYREDFRQNTTAEGGSLSN